jgi:FAD/FMN-containing dehydrogenase
MTDWIAELAASLGAEHVTTDADDLRFFSQDVFGEGALPQAAVAPPTVDALAATVGRLTAQGVAIVPRGGGLSYTDGYLVRETGAAGFALIDLRRLDRLVELNLADRYITVECGMTWAALDAHLAPHGVRTPYWGPLSGLQSTVGGALSQGSVFLGSGQHGAVGDAVLSLEVVLANGRLIRTGSAAAAGTAPFLRWFGPDATGCFVGDAGALGVKARATLRLIPRPREIAFASCEYAGPLPMFAAMAEVSRAGLAAECFAFDPVLTEMRKKRMSLASDAKALLGVVRQSGLRAGLSLALAGRDFIGEDRWSAHVSVEAQGKGELAERLAAARALLVRDGSEVENSFPKALRGMPFTAPNTMLGPAGERWVPVHGVFPHSAAPRAFAALEALFAGQAAAMREHGLRAGYLCTTIAHQATLIEPVLYWGDRHTLYHRRMVEAEYRARAGEPAPNPAATALAGRLKRELADCMRALGGTHFQIGRFYRWRDGRDAAALALHDAMKAALDPRGLMNPGVLA